MLFNDILILETLVLFSVLFYLFNTNIMMLLYSGGIFLLMSGIIGLLNDGDIYIGFLWVIDLGVGLIFFIFVLHFSTFLSQKSAINLTLRNRIISFITFLVITMFFILTPQPVYNNYKGSSIKSWFFKINYLDYYKIYNTHEITDLQTLKDSYFIMNSYEFYVINFSLFFGLISAILLFFLIKRIFTFMNYNYLKNNRLVDKVNTNFFIRHQDFIRQQNTPMSTRLWVKTKKKN